MGDKAGASAVERAFADYLGSLADRADGLRVEARSTLERGVRQAHDMGWSQRRIAASLGRSQPEVRRLLHRGLEGDPDAVRARAEAVARESVLDDVLRRRRDEIVAVAERYGARRVRVFGSVATGTDGADSDVDLLVDVEDEVGLFSLGAMEVELEQLLGRPVDVVPERSLRPSVRESIGAIPL